MRLARPRVVMLDPAVSHGVQLTSSNTGVPAGTTLTPQVTSGGTIPAGTYVDKLFGDPSPDGVYQVPTGPASFTRCHFVGGLGIETATGITIDHCTIEGGFYASTSHTGLVVDSYLTDPGGDFIHLTGDSPADSTCDDWVFRRVLCELLPAQQSNVVSGAHLDGIQTRGVTNLWLDMCAWRMGDQWNHFGDPLPLNACVFPENANGGTNGFRMTNCYLDGGTQVFFMQAFTGTYEITGNRWGPRFSGQRVRNDGGLTPTLWSGNVVDLTGAAVNY